jgi:hypothetical protein
VRQTGDAISVTNDYATYEKQLVGKEMDVLKGLPGELQDAPLGPYVDVAELVDPHSGKPRHLFKPGDAIDVVIRYHNRKDEPIPLCLGVGFTRTAPPGATPWPPSPATPSSTSYARSRTPTSSRTSSRSASSRRPRSTAARSTSSST